MNAPEKAEQNVLGKQAVALRLIRPFGKTLLTAVLILIVVLTATELIIRALTTNEIIEPPILRTGMPQFDAKLTRLETLYRENGKVDCIVIGSSMVDAGFDPLAFAAARGEQNGTPITCFNFGINGLTAKGAGLISNGLVHRYHPELLYYITSARDYVAGYHKDTRELQQSPQLGWLLQVNSLGSWLFQHSYLFGWLSTPSYWTNPQYMNAYYEEFNLMTSLGFRPFKKGKGIPVDFDHSNLQRYNLDSEDVAGLREVLSLADAGSKVLVVEMPVYPGYLPYYIKSSLQAYYNDFLIPVENVVRSHGEEFTRTVSDIAVMIPDAGWKDPTHLNVEGAKIFSTRLAVKQAKK